MEPVDPNDLTPEQLAAYQAAQVDAILAPRPVPMGWTVATIPAPPGASEGAFVRFDFKMVTGQFVGFLSADHQVGEDGAVDLSSVSQAEDFGQALVRAAQKARSQIEVPKPGSNGIRPVE